MRDIENVTNLPELVRYLKDLKKGKYNNNMTGIWGRIFSGLAETGLVLAQSSKNPTIAMIAGLVTVFFGAVTNPSAPTAEVHAQEAKALLTKK